MDDPDLPVQRILVRASRLTHDEAAALDAALRARPAGDAEARAALDAHARWKNEWAMFDHWPDPAIEMGWARQRVEVALGLPRRRRDAIERDDGTVAWGAATAATFAVLAAGRAGGAQAYRMAWDEVMGEQSGDLDARLE